MKKRLTVFALLCLAALPARADFNSVARAIESAHGATRMPLPMFALARLAVRLTHPDGVLDMKLAMFDQHAFRNAQDVASVIESNAGRGFQRLVSTWSRNTGESAVVFARIASADRVELLVFSLDDDEAVLVQMDVDPRTFAEQTTHPATLSAMGDGR